MRITLLQFSFRGGNLSEYDIQSTEKGDDSWKGRIDEMAITAFPTRPRDTSDIPATAFANFPAKGSGGNVRIHCGYFQIIRARAFRNVFCFAYRTRDCSLVQLAGVSAEEWYRCCLHLQEGSRVIEVEETEGVSSIPEFETDGDKVILYQFPNQRGRIYTKLLSDMEEWIQFIKPPQLPQPGLNLPDSKPPVVRGPRMGIFFAVLVISCFFVSLSIFLKKSKDCCEYEVIVPSGDSSPRPIVEGKEHQSPPNQVPIDVVGRGTSGSSDNGRLKPSDRVDEGIDMEDPHNHPASTIPQPHPSIEGTESVSSAVDTVDKKENYGGANTSNLENGQQAKGKSSSENTEE